MLHAPALTQMLMTVSSSSAVCEDTCGARDARSSHTCAEATLYSPRRPSQSTRSVEAGLRGVDEGAASVASRFPEGVTATSRPPEPLLGTTFVHNVVLNDI